MAKQEKENKPAAAVKDKKVWLTWDEQRIWVLHPTRGSNFLSALTKADAVVTRKEVEEQLKKQRQLNILPGLHEYPAELWAACVDHEDVQQALNDGRLHLATNEDFGLKGEATEAAQELPQTLDEVATGQARLMAQNCQELDVLERWLEAEKKNKARGTVLSELEVQISIVKETEKTLDQANQ